MTAIAIRPKLQKIANNILLNILLGFFSVFILPALCLAQTPDTLWIEDWEGDWTQNWNVDAGTWEVGGPTSGPGGAFAGQNCAATVLGGNYSENVDSRLIRHTSFVVPNESENPRLRFWHWFSFSQADTGFVQIKVGSENWQSISMPYTRTGSSVWTSPSIDLTLYAGSTVQLAFFFKSRQVGGGADVSTGWYIDDVAIITGPVVFKQFEDWESGIDECYVDKGTWEVGTPTSGPGSAFTGQNSAATVLSGNYHENVDSRLICPAFIVQSASQNPRLTFWHWFSFSQADTGFVQIKVEDGDWETIQDFINTSSGVWSFTSIDISKYAGLIAQIAFFFKSRQVGGGADVSSGWYLDDITSEGIPTSVSESEVGIPTKFSLQQNYPNPFNPTTIISYGLPQSTPVVLTIYNLLGREIRKLVDENQSVGEHTIQWDGRGSDGNEVSSGVYVYRLNAGSFHQTRKMLLLR